MKFFISTLLNTLLSLIFSASLLRYIFQVPIKSYLESLHLSAYVLVTVRMVASTIELKHHTVFGFPETFIRDAGT